MAARQTTHDGRTPGYTPAMRLTASVTHPSLVAPPAFVLALSALLLGLAASPALATEVALEDAGFSPSTIEVEPGESIMWVNRTDEVQTVIGEDGTWDSGPLRPGETFSVAFRDPGTFRYAADDGAVVGTVRVVEATQDAAEAQEDATEDGSAADGAAQPAPGALPNTGSRTLPLLGWGLVLVGAGALCVRRAAHGRR